MRQVWMCRLFLASRHNLAKNSALAKLKSIGIKEEILHLLDSYLVKGRWQCLQEVNHSGSRSSSGKWERLNHLQQFLQGHSFCHEVTTLEYSNNCTIFNSIWNDSINKTCSKTWPMAEKWQITFPSQKC